MSSTSESFISEESSLRHVFTTKQGLSLEDRNGVRRLKPSEDSSGDIVKKPVFDVNKLLDQQRVLKSPNEVKCMKRTCSIGSQALSYTRDFSRDVTRDNINNLNISLINESQVAAKFDFESRVKGQINWRILLLLQEDQELHLFIMAVAISSWKKRIGF